MRFAYADPPYLGVAKKRYPEHPESWVYDTVDGHRQLIDRLVGEFPDGWTYSLSAKSLYELLPLCPPDVRVMAWVKPWTAFRKNVNPAWAWEPVIVFGGRRRGSQLPTVRDWLSANAPHVNGKGFTGRKPLEFCWWLFEVLGAAPDDEIVDLFPGSGAVTIAWEAWLGQLRHSA
jgi:hypothetical protein